MGAGYRDDMSVIVIGKMKVNPANVAKLWADRGSDFKAISEAAKAAGCTRHRWGFGDGYVMIVDEWSDAASFQTFFDTQTLIPELMQAGGVEGPPAFDIVEYQKAPDEF